MVGMQEARAVAGAGAHTLIAAMTSAYALGQILGPLCLLIGIARARTGRARHHNDQSEQHQEKDGRERSEGEADADGSIRHHEQGFGHRAF